MKISIKFILISLFIITCSCLLTARSNFNPCKNNFLHILDSLSPKDLEKLESELKNQKYNNDEQEGCQAVFLGRIKLAQGSNGEASRYFGVAAKKIPELRDYFILAKAWAELKNHDYLEAKNLATSLLNTHINFGPTNFLSRINHILAQVALKQKDHQQIINTHQELLKQGYGDKEALLFNLATSLSIMGEHKKSDDILKKLITNYPSSDHKIKNFANIQLDIKANEIRFEKLIENLAFDRIVSEADKKLKNNPNLDSQNLFNTFAIKALILNNKFDAGLKRAEALATRKNSTSADLDNYAWALGKVDRYIKAADFYTRMSISAKDPNLKAKGCFFAGFSLYEASYYSLAQLSWQRCHDIIKNSSYYENYLWHQALSALLSENNQLAQNILVELTKKFNKSSENDKYIYFHGYALNQLNKKQAGDALFLKLAMSPKPNYYNLLARQRLALKAPQSKAISADAFSQKTCKNQDCQKALKLYDLGFLEDARDVALAMPGSVEQKIALLQKMGLYHDAWKRSHAVASEAQIKNNKLIASPAIRSSYPQVHENIINEMSKKYSVNKSLLYAIIKIESGFAHDAKSNRGALGLMQMMPFVAHDLASKLALNEFDPEHLKEPKISIELGSLLLAILKRQFEHTHLVVAAYNAGGHQVQKWLDRFGHLAPELFVERIPFKQTRDYIKKVSTSESLYVALSGQPFKLML